MNKKRLQKRSLKERFLKKVYNEHTVRSKQKIAQHCQKKTPEFLIETISAAKQMTNQPLLVHMDSGNDSLENYTIMHWDDPKIKFLVKHNFRRENRD